MRILPFLIPLLLSVRLATGAGYCDLIGTQIYAQDNLNGLGTYLGLVSDNPYSTESILNQYGTYGSKYSSTSILNPYGTFGSQYSTYSPYSPYSAYTTTPPILVSYDALSQTFTPVAYLSKNKYLTGATADPDLLLATLSSGTCGGVYVPPVVTKPDLIIDSLVAVQSKGKDSLYFGYIVANIGTVAAPAFTVGVVVNGVSLGTITFQPLAARQYVWDYRGIKVAKDTTTIIIMADAGGAVAEENELNNFGNGVYLTPRPSLAILPKPTPGAIPDRFKGKAFDLLGRAFKAPLSIRP